VIRPLTANRNGELPRFDKLSVEQQIVLKMASVCGATFSLYTVNLTLDKMGYLTIKNKTEKIFVDMEEKSLIKRVFGTQDRKESKSNIVSGLSPVGQSLKQTEFGPGSDSQGSPASFRALGSFRGESFRSPGSSNPKMRGSEIASASVHRCLGNAENMLFDAEPTVCKLFSDAR
jgi:hypothetical protein